MKKLLFLFLLFISSVGFSQNGGQSDENNVLRIKYVAYIAGSTSNHHKFQVTNLLSCPVTIRFEVKNLNYQKDTALKASESLDLFVSGLSTDFVQGRVKRTSQADCVTNPDNGWVEVIGNGIVLPLNKIKNYKLLNKRKI